MDGNRSNALKDHRKPLPFHLRGTREGLFHLLREDNRRDAETSQFSETQSPFSNAPEQTTQRSIAPEKGELQTLVLSDDFRFNE